MIASARGLLIATVALIFGALGLASSAAALAMPSPATATFTCYVHNHTAVSTFATPKRGPPTFGDTMRPTVHAIGVLSRGASACSGGSTALSRTTYDDFSGFVLVASATTTESVGTLDGDASTLDRPSVAAKGATSLADEASGLLGSADDIVVLGRQADTAVAKGWNGHVVLDTPKWSLELNDAFIQGAIQQRRTIYLASPTKGNLVQTSGAYAGQPTVYARELQMLRNAGYTRSGDYMVPR